MGKSFAKNQSKAHIPNDKIQKKYKILSLFSASSYENPAPGIDPDFQSNTHFRPIIEGQFFFSPHFGTVIPMPLF